MSSIPEQVLHQQFLKIQQLNSAACQLEHEASRLRAVALSLGVILDEMKKANETEILSRAGG